MNRKTMLKLVAHPGLYTAIVATLTLLVSLLLLVLGLW